MKIHIVSYEDLDTWICGKIARRLTEALTQLGHDCTVSKVVDPAADVNHHVIYLNYGRQQTGVHTLMVTHIDDISKFQKLREGLESAKAAICMSSDGVAHLTTLGLDRSKLAHVNLAHDGKAIPRRFVIGITTRLYPDGRKREDHVSKLIELISPNDFAFKIMGFGWRPIVERMQKLGFQIEYHEEFNYDAYIQLVSTLDYFMYLGEDEGSMGFIDALAAGVKTIVHPQGHHLDAKNGITHAVKNFDQLRETFAQIAAQRKQLTDAVGEWTWLNYARQHVGIWERCLAGLPVESLAIPARTHSRWATYLRLWANVFIRKGTMITNLGNDYDCGSRWWSARAKRRKR